MIDILKNTEITRNLYHLFYYTGTKLRKKRLSGPCRKPRKLGKECDSDVLCAPCSLVFIQRLYIKETLAVFITEIKLDDIAINNIRNADETVILANNISD